MGATDEERLQWDLPQTAKVPSTPIISAHVQKNRPMQNDRLLTDAEHLRLQAEQMRAIADHMKDPRNKQIALSVAADYDRQAEHAERRSSERPCD